MKKTVFTALIGASLLWSCAGEEEPKTEIEKIKKESKEVEESGVSTPLAFNDGLMAEITRIDVRYAELQDFDAIDTTAVAIEDACDRAIAEANEVISGIEKFNVVGTRGDEFKSVSISLAREFKNYAEGFKGLADVYSTPDKDWSDDMLDRWDKFDQEIAAPYDKVSAEFNDLQHEYFSLNNLKAGETIDVKSIYDEEKSTK